MQLFNRFFLKCVRAEMFNWMPTKLYLKMFYVISTGKWLNLKNPTGFCEKLQWLKLYDHKSEYATMVDKYLVKDYVTEKIGAQYVIPTYGIWSSADEIDFSLLPEKFVLKTTHDSGGVCIIDKTKGYDVEKIIKFLNIHLDCNLYNRTREWPYKNVKPCIIAEKYLEDNNISPLSTINDGLIDYKFYCFNGVPKFLYVGFANMNGTDKDDQMTFYDLKWNKTPFGRNDHHEVEFDVAKPDKFEEMIIIAKKLSTNIPFLRVDLFYINGSILFSELTFSPGGGFACFTPYTWEQKIGSWIKLPKNNKD